MSAPNTRQPCGESAGEPVREYDEDDDDYSDCPECGGAAWVTRFEEDPLWYGEDELFPCATCNPDGNLPLACPW